MGVAVRFEHISKKYHIGTIGTGMIAHDIKRWWMAEMLGKEDPFSKIGETVSGRRAGKHGTVWALRDIDLEVQEGEVLGIIGRNGAGKSTLLKILSRVTTPTAGKICVKGRIASLLEVGTGFHPEMTGRENIFMNGAIMGMTKSEIRRKFDEIVDFSGVERYIDTPVKRYSSGMSVRLGFAVAAHLDPEILVVDEVLAVGDAEFQKRAIGKMQDVTRTQGRTVLFVSHNLGSIKVLCSKCLCLSDGNLSHIGLVDSAISRYLDHFFNNIELKNQDLLRSGNKKVTFNSFHIENNLGYETSTIFAGEEFSLVFELKCNKTHNKNIDLGFSLHDSLDKTLAVLYSSFDGFVFSTEDEELVVMKCLIKNQNFAPNKIAVKVRILVDGEESDRIENAVGFFYIEIGSFYKVYQYKEFQSYHTESVISGKWLRQKNL